MPNIANAPDRDPNILIVPMYRGPSHVTETRTVIEKRAPTDDSVRLLREMEAKAEARILESVRVADTVFECVVHSYRDVVNDKMVYRAVVKLNGRTVTAEHAVWTMDAKDLRAAWEALRDKLATAIASEVLKGAFAATMRARNLG